MKITKIQLRNFRLLKDLKLDLEEIISIVIGKNNCGKTSLLSALNKFIGDKSSSNSFAYDDFNIEFKSKLYSYIKDNKIVWEKQDGISLLIFIEYNEKDELSNISNLMLDLNPDNRIVVLKFEYSLDIDNFNKMKEKFEEYKSKHIVLSSDELECFENFAKSQHKKFFKVRRKAVQYDNSIQDVNLDEFIDLDKKKVDISKIINFKYIGARRSITNIENDGTLSDLSSKYYEKTEINDSQSKAIEDFENALIETDSKLSAIYDDLFEDVVEKVKKFGGMKKDETVIKVISSLQRRELLKGNTTVVYDDNNHYLPESYNGLGYLNLISMIFEIETLLSDFRKDNMKDVKPADVNLLFIEEPEAHTHPQMQYIFIKNIKDILEEGSNGSNNNKSFELQTIITTHSSHIVSECEFDNIKYFRKDSSNYVEAKNLKQLEIEYSKEQDIGKAHFKFLKQYLTLNRSEIFFADKAIFIEGDTERLLVPAMMKKIDDEDKDMDVLPLLSQNISVIEVGNYSQIFDKFIEFIGIKALIITDIDSGKEVLDKDEKGTVKMKADRTAKIKVEASPVDESICTSNGALKHYYKKEIEKYLMKYGRNEIDYFKNLDIKDKVLIKENDEWQSSVEGYLMLVYQVEEVNEDGEFYNARSFEDAFFHINRKLIIDNKDKFKSLKNINYFDKKESSSGKYKYDSYELAEKCIQSKPSFAMDVLLNSICDDKSNYSNWKIPKYIKDGLIWLKKN
ncbi:AAA family ATPase [Clostridium perfringens]|uniref:AAA family ATPase n=1 Tax=Clostridium perfringens TaxID=1502 RepID=UPI0018E41E99|nr:AAA family ATPase [Clostridium perfringens]ELC8340098.1 AAA family ATPase [Clostridium perfringens]MBI5990259.1 AAA family ATPase [Clostridium perfringens]